MASSLSWLDTSESDRRRALDVIDLFSRRDTLDELGLGTVRDALADALFPGTSTIQTRARYFLFIPWIYRRLEAQRVPSSRIAHRARHEELRLIEPLVSSPDPDGVIGREARRQLKRLPGSIYWAGLGTWGIRLFPGSLDQYHRSLDRHYAALDRTARLAGDGDAAAPGAINWHPHLPQEPDGFPAGAALALRRQEAEYLQDRILTRASGSLLAFLVEHPTPPIDAPFPWALASTADLPGQVATPLHHARCFSELLHGAALLYNVMLGEDAGLDDARDRHRRSFDAWADIVTARDPALRAWSRPDFWTFVQRISSRIPIPTRTFVESWIDLALAAARPADLAEDATARTLVRERELHLKRSRARLGNRTYLEAWRGSSGAAQLDYRWGTVRTIVNDILRGLAATADDARAA